MRLTQIVCPECKAALTSKAGIEEGTSIACPKCKRKFDAFAPDEGVVEDDFDFVNDEEDETPAKKPVSKRGAVEDDDEEETPKKKTSRQNNRDDDDEDERPKPKKRRGDDDDDQPSAKKNKRNEDDSGDRPRPKKKRKHREDDDEELGAYGKLKKNIWVRISVLGVLLGILGVLVYFKYVKKTDDAPTPIAHKEPDDDLSKPIRPDPNKNANVKPKEALPDTQKVSRLLVGDVGNARGAGV